MRSVCHLTLVMIKQRSVLLPGSTSVLSNCSEEAWGTDSLHPSLLFLSNLISIAKGCSKHTAITLCDASAWQVERPHKSCSAEERSAPFIPISRGNLWRQQSRTGNVHLNDTFSVTWGDFARLTYVWELLESLEESKLYCNEATWMQRIDAFESLWSE